MMKIVAIAFGLLAAQTATATVIDFDDLKNPGPYITFPSYSSQGYNFTSSSTNADALGAWGTEYSTYSADPQGATLFSNAANAVVTVSRADGQKFNLYTLDFADAINENGSTALVLNLFTDKGEVTQLFGRQYGKGLETIDVDWSGLKYFQFYGFGGSFQQIDNVVLSSPAGVPEPATWAIMTIGLGFVGLTMRRRKTTDPILG